MAYGQENLIGTGQAQVLPRGQGYEGLVDNLNQQRNIQFQRKREARIEDEKKQANLYGLIGDELNPKDFNATIHYKVQEAQKELANKILTEKPDYGQMYLMAHNKAAELAKISDALNRIDQQISLTKDAYKSDKRLNLGAAEIAARKRILLELGRGIIPDESVNYIESALNEPSLQEALLADNSDYVDFDMRSHKMDDMTGGIKQRVAGRTTDYKYRLDNYPAFYKYDPGKTEYDAPSVSVSSEDSGLIDPKTKQSIPMASESAYNAVLSKGRSNVVALNRILKKKYGADFNTNSKEADILRRVEVYNQLESQKPKPNLTKSDLSPQIRNVTNINSGGSKGNDTQDFVQRWKGAAEKKDGQALLDLAGEFYAGNGQYKFEGISIHPDNMGAVIKYKPKDALQGEPLLQETIKLDDPDAYFKLAGLYQKITGSDAKLEKNIFTGSKDYSNQKPAGQTKPEKSTGGRPPLSSFIKQ